MSSERARTLIELGRPAEAIPLLVSALATDPEDADANCSLARAQIEMERPEEAVRAAEAAIALAPGEELPHRIRAVALGQLGRRKQALARAREAVVLAPEMADAHAVLASAELARERLPAAREAAERAVALDPESVLAHDAAGRVALAQSRLVDAEAAFRAAMELDPEDAVAMNNLAVVLTRTGRREEALPLLEGSARTDPRLEASRENVSTTARDVLNGGGWLVPVVFFIAVRAISAADREGVPLGVAFAVVILIGMLAIAVFERIRMKRLSPAARALIRDERRRFRRRPWTWRPHAIYLPWPVLVGRKVPAPLWLVLTLAALAVSVADAAEIGPGAAVVFAGFAILAALACWRTRVWLLRRGWLY